MATRVEQDDRDWARIADDRVDERKLAERAGVALIRLLAARAAHQVVVLVERPVEADVVVAGHHAVRQPGDVVDHRAQRRPLGGVAGVDLVAAPDHGAGGVSRDVARARGGRRSRSRCRSVTRAMAIAPDRAELAWRGARRHDVGIGHQAAHLDKLVGCHEQLGTRAQHRRAANAHADLDRDPQPGQREPGPPPDIRGGQRYQ